MPSNGYFSFLYIMLEKHLSNSFLPYLVAEILQLVAFQWCSIKEVFWKTSQNSQANTRSSHPEVFCKKMFLKYLKISQKTPLPESLFWQSCRIETVRSSLWRCSIKQGVLKNFPNFPEENLWRSLFLIQLLFWGPKAFLKKPPTQVLSC